MQKYRNNVQPAPAPAAPPELSPAAARAYDQIISGHVHAFYSSNAWRRTAAAARARDRNECQDCKRRGLYTPAAAVHHVEFILQNPARALDMNNLVTLCAACHEARHAPAGACEGSAGYSNAERW